MIIPTVPIDWSDIENKKILGIEGQFYYHGFPLSDIPVQRRESPVVVVMVWSAIQLNQTIVLPGQVVADHTVHPTNDSGGGITQFGKLELLSKWQREMIRRSSSPGSFIGT